MKRIALISDIHSNIFALDAVLQDIEAQGMDLIVNLGDTLLGPIDPVATANRLMNMENLVNIMGNGDEKLLKEHGTSNSYKFVKPLLSKDMTQWLGTFKHQWVYENILFCHGSPHSNCVYLVEEVIEENMVRKPVERLLSELESVEQDYIVCGHSHLGKWTYLAENKMVLNPGSVGLPAYADDAPKHNVETFSPYAKYAVITVDRKGICKTEHVELRYDWQRASEVAKRNGSEGYAYSLKTGRALIL